MALYSLKKSRSNCTYLLLLMTDYLFYSGLDVQTTLISASHFPVILLTRGMAAKVEKTRGKPNP